MKDSDVRRIQQKLAERYAGFSEKVVKAGWLESAKYPDGTPVAYVAAIQEYGAPSQSIPPRPFFRPAIEQNKDAWAAKFRKGVMAAGQGKYTADQVLEGIGLMAEGDISKSISEVNSPELSPITIMLRKMRAENPSLKVTGKIVGEAAAKVAAKEDYSFGNTKPLNDSGNMLATVTHVVGEKE